MKRWKWIAIASLVAFVVLASWNVYDRASLPKDPGYNDLITFLKTDHSEVNSQSGYVSHADFTARFLGNASKQKIKGYPVVVALEYRLLVFASFKTEKGWVYIFPANDREIKLEKGKSFRGLNPKDDSFGAGNDTILEILILGNY